jgi:hypothetical protein
MKTANTTNTPDTEEVARATRHGRAALIALLAIAVALIFSYGAFLLSVVEAAASTGNFAEAMTSLKLAWAACLVLGILPALFLIMTGWKTLRLGRFPLPGAWVLRDTPVKRGPAAARAGWAHITAGVIGLLLCIFLGGYSWLLFDRLPLARELPTDASVISRS